MDKIEKERERKRLDAARRRARNRARAATDPIFAAEQRSKNRERARRYLADEQNRANKNARGAAAQRRRRSDPARREALLKYQREKMREYNTGVSADTYTRMFDAQNGRCAICHSDEAKGRGAFHIDHCHTTGVIRGLLCTTCNTGLGKFHDSSALLREAIDYLKRHQPDGVYASY